MSTFVGISPFSNPLWVAMETMHFHIVHTKIFKDTFVSHSGGPNEQFGTHENCPGGCKVTLIGSRVYFLHVTAPSNCSDVGRKKSVTFYLK